MSSSDSLQRKLAKLSIEHTKGKPRRKVQPRSKTQSKKTHSERPNKHSDRVAWNEHFENEIARNYAPLADASLPSSCTFTMNDNPEIHSSARSLGLTTLNQQNASTTKELLQEEGILIGLAIEVLFHGEFEAKWKELDMKRKEEIVLEGLYRGACLAPRDNSRVSCPEMTIKGLVGNGEYSLINMLKGIVNHDPTVAGTDQPVKDLYLFPHPWIERQYSVPETTADDVKALGYLSLLLRNWYIVAALQEILQTYNGRSPRPVIPILTSGHKSLSEEQRQGRQQTREDHRNGTYYVDESQCKEEAANPRLYACYNCRSTSKARDGLKQCGKCRLAWYCSAKCQSQDWEDHKKYCGKQTFDPKFYTPTTKSESPTNFIGCPDPAPGFVRTAALRRQIWYLNKADSQDRVYHFNIAVGRTRSIVFLGPSTRIRFLVARRHAFASGSIPAILTMYMLVEKEISLGLFILPDGVLRKQFEMEYGVIITPSLIQTAKPWLNFVPTEQECMEEKEFWEQRIASV